MNTERERMLAGELYDPADPELVAARERARALCHTLNTMPGRHDAAHRAVLEQLLGSGGDTANIHPHFHCDYGSNIHLGRNVFFNFNCVVLDVCEVHIGDFTMFGSGVQVLTPLHPMNAMERRGREYGKPVHIGADVWVGAGALILPGVRIGSRSVIGAGSVVTRDIPDDVVAVGNPCRVLRNIAE